MKMPLITDLINAINLITTISVFGNHSFNPLGLIKAVNYCHSLGHNKSLQILQLYCHLIEQRKTQFSRILNDIEQGKTEFADILNDIEQRKNQFADILNFIEIDVESEKIFMIARILFIRRNKRIVLPRLRLGQPDIEPTDLSLFPWFPLHLYEDIPYWLLIFGYTVFGEPELPSTYLDWCKRKCEIRETPLTPNNNPLESIDKFFKSEVWKTLECPRTTKENSKNRLENQFQRRLKIQALSTISNVYCINERNIEELLFCQSKEEADEIWTRHKNEFAKLDVSWNSVKNDYELRD